ncbi:MAG TPA: RNA polymerase subunit sigma-70 [Polyangiaceae bacterium]
MRAHEPVENARTPEDEAVVAAARCGDKAAFAELTERYRRELRAYCYRMLGSFDDSEDLVQETFLKAWRARESFEGRSSLRSWLYRIATNACLDFLASSRRQVLARDPSEPPELPPHVPWLQPYPDALLEPPAPGDAEPDARALVKERIELAYLVALQFLPARQRAALVLCDALDWPAKEAASFLGMTSAAVNASLQRARATLREDPSARRPPPSKLGSEKRREFLTRYVEAHERADVDAIAALLHEDLRFSMPPEPTRQVGRDRIVRGWVEGGFGAEDFGAMRCLVTTANRLPAVAVYRRKPGAVGYRPMALDVLRIEGTLVREVTTFDLGAVREAFGLPEELP